MNQLPPPPPVKVETRLQIPFVNDCHCVVVFEGCTDDFGNLSSELSFNQLYCESFVRFAEGMGKRPPIQNTQAPSASIVSNASGSFASWSGR